MGCVKLETKSCGRVEFSLLANGRTCNRHRGGMGHGMRVERKARDRKKWSSATSQGKLIKLVAHSH